MKRQKPYSNKITQAFKTYAALDIEKQDAKTNVHIPSINCVEEAKNWVDENRL